MYLYILLYDKVFLVVGFLFTYCNLVFDYSVSAFRHIRLPQEYHSSALGVRGAVPFECLILSNTALVQPNRHHVTFFLPLA